MEARKTYRMWCGHEGKTNPYGSQSDNYGHTYKYEKNITMYFMEAASENVKYRCLFSERF